LQVSCFDAEKWVLITRASKGGVRGLTLDGAKEVIVRGPQKVTLHAHSKESLVDVTADEGWVVVKMRPVGAEKPIIVEQVVRRSRKGPFPEWVLTPQVPAHGE
jgi:hypothetical protein